jgi:hypothetical protein
MSTDCAWHRAPDELVDDHVESDHTLARQWWHAGIAFAVLLAFLTMGAWVMTARGDHRSARSVPVIHESF